MKTLLFLFGIAVAWVLGYMYEPSLRPSLIGSTAKPLPSVVPPQEPEKEAAPIPAISPVEAEPVAVPQEPPVTIPESQPTAQAEPEPATPVEPEPTASAEPEPAPQKAVTPEPQKPAQPAKPVPSANTREVDVVKLMQSSIRKREISEFQYNDVTDWKQAPNETYQGNVFQVGIASYKAETVMGEKQILAKALIKDGKIVRWIWPKSGLQIK